jgi:hypothetical protein
MHLTILTILNYVTHFNSSESIWNYTKPPQNAICIRGDMYCRADFVRELGLLVKLAMLGPNQLY